MTSTTEQDFERAIQHQTAGRLAEAEEIYRRILEDDPNQPSALHLLGLIAHQVGQYDVAAELISKALTVQPEYAEAHYNLGKALQELRRQDDAAASYQKALEINPQFAEAHFNLGNVFQELRRLGDAAESYRRAIAAKPDHAKAHVNLGVVFRGLGQLDQMVACYREALAIDPAYADAHSNLGAALQALGQLDDAIGSYRQALSIDPNSARAGKNLLYGLLNVPGLTPDDLFDEHVRFAEHHTRAITPVTEDFANDASPDRRLRVGYLSSDFHNHPVGQNVLPLISHHDKSSFEVFCYADVPNPDVVSEQFRSCVDHWHSITGMTDAEIADMVRADAIDIIVLLAGHFDKNRPLFAAHRAAPVQVSYHDGATSGLEAMDYWLTDGFLHPADTKERFTEDLCRLPVFYQYMPIEDAPPVGPIAADQAGGITFGSFNNPAKINGEVIGLWAEVLNSVPGSRLLFKYKNWYSQSLLRDRVTDGFAAVGVGADRLAFEVSDDTFTGYLGRYEAVDIALDPFPFNGATTTYQALWMGVPVVALAGDSFISRAAGSLLHHVCLDDLVADTPEDYVARARDLAGDLERLRHLRAGLRDRVAASPLCDAPAYAKSVEAAFLEMWHHWCAAETGS